MPIPASEQELQELQVIDYHPDTVFEYQFRGGGDLEFVDVTGRWRRVRGCSGDPENGVHEFEENLNELDHLVSLMSEAMTGDVTLEQLYLTNERFRYLVNECIQMNQIKLRWFSPRMIGWMLFDRIEKRFQVRAALRVLNHIGAGRYGAGGGIQLQDKADWMAMIATYCQGDLSKGHQLARAVGARDLMAELDALGYFSLDAKARHQRNVERWAREEREKGRRTAHVGTPAEEAQSTPVSSIPKPRVRAISQTPQPEPQPQAEEETLAEVDTVSPEDKTQDENQHETQSVDNPNLSAPLPESLVQGGEADG